MKRSFSGDRGLQERVVVSGGATQNQVVEKLVQGGNQFGNRFVGEKWLGGGATQNQYAEKFVQGVNQIRTQNQVVEKFVRASNHGDFINSSD